MHSNNPLISIVIPTYNRADLLLKTLDSILEQSYTTIELIVVDNYSNDNTAELLRQLSINNRTIRYFRNMNYGIIARNRNFGIHLARGKYICFCDSDDLWERDKLIFQVAHMESHNEVALCCTSGRLINAKGQLIGDYFKTLPPPNITYQSLLTRNHISTVSVMVRKDVLSEKFLFNESPQLIGIEDYHLWLRIAKIHEVHCVPFSLVRYRIHDHNCMGVDSYIWAAKCMMLAQFMRKHQQISNPDFLRMFTYNLAKRIFYSGKRLNFFGSNESTDSHVF